MSDSPSTSLREGSGWLLWPLLAFFSVIFVQLRLAEHGHFGPWIAWITVLLFALLVATSGWYLFAQIRLRLAGLPHPRLRFLGALSLAVGAVAIAGALYHVPSERITGYNDQGTYTLQAVNLARTGSLWLHAPALDTEDPSLRELLIERHPTQAQRDVPNQQLRDTYLGFFVRPGHPAELESQFPPGYPLLLADAYAVLGWRGMQSVNTALLIASALLGGLLTLRWFGVLPALGAIVAFVLFPLHVWLGNMFFAEAAIIFGWLAILVALDHLAESNPLDATGWTALVGFGLAHMVSVKIDGLPAALAAAIPLVEALRRRPRLPVVALRLLALAPAIYAVIGVARTADRYLAETLSSLVNTPGAKAIGGAAATLVVVAVASGGLYYWRSQRTRRMGTTTETRAAADQHNPSRMELALRLLLVGALFAILAHFYFIRPEQVGTDRYYYWPLGREIHSLREVTLVRLGWYFSPILLWTALVGVLAFVYRARQAAQLLLLALGIGTLLLFAFDLHNNPIQPYANRRFLTYATPCLVFGLASIVAMLRGVPRVGPSVAILLIVGTGLTFGRIDWKLNRASDCVGLHDQLQALAHRIPADAIVVIPAKAPVAEFAGTLQFLHGRTVYNVGRKAFSEPSAAALQQELLRQQSLGRSIWFLGPNARAMDRRRYREEPGAAYSSEIVATSIAQSTTTQPFGVETRRWSFHLRQVEVLPPASPYFPPPANAGPRRLNRPQPPAAPKRTPPRP